MIMPNKGRLQRTSRETLSQGIIDKIWRPSLTVEEKLSTVLDAMNSQNSACQARAHHVL